MLTVYPTLTRADSITFRLRSSGERLRQFPFPVGPRRLGDTLLEFSTGGSWWMEDLDGGVTFKAGTKRVFVVPAEHSHTLRMVKGPAMRTRWALVALEDEIGRDLFLQLPRAILLSPTRSARAVQILLAMQTVSGAALVDRLEFQHLGLQLASIILAQNPAPLIASAGLIGDRIETVLRFIRDHLHMRLCRQDLARQAHLSQTRFHYVFLEATGQSPMKYLMAQRIRRARQLLVSTKLSGQEIGTQCGFESTPHFTRMFTRCTGMSPLRYRVAARQI